MMLVLHDFYGNGITLFSKLDEILFVGSSKNTGVSLFNIGSLTRVNCSGLIQDNDLILVNNEPTKLTTLNFLDEEYLRLLDLNDIKNLSNIIKSNDLNVLKQFCYKKIAGHLDWFSLDRSGIYKEIVNQFNFFNLADFKTFLCDGDMDTHLMVKDLAFEFVDTIGEFQVVELGYSLEFDEDGDRLDEETTDYLFEIEQKFSGAICAIMKEIYP